MDTLLLDQTTWDLVLDIDGNIAVASAPYALAQDAASAVKLFQAELWYDTKQGVPYYGELLGHMPPLQLVKQEFTDAALTVPGVTAAKVFITGLAGRKLTGQVQVTDKTGTVSVATF